MSFKRKLLAAFLWLLTVLWMVQIYFFSAQTGEESASLSGGLLARIVELFGAAIGHTALRKIAHASEFFLLSLFVFSALYASVRRRMPATAFSVSAFYAITDEIHQIFVDGRAAQVTDVLIDCGGVLIGIALCCAVTACAGAVRKKNKTTMIGW